MTPNELITSFVVRFVRRQASGTGVASLPWHDVIHHVQSGQEAHFQHLDEAATFMARFLPTKEDLQEKTPGHFSLREQIFNLVVTVQIQNDQWGTVKELFGKE